MEDGFYWYWTADEVLDRFDVSPQIVEVFHSGECAYAAFMSSEDNQRVDNLRGRFVGPLIAPEKPQD